MKTVNTNKKGHIKSSPLPKFKIQKQNVTKNDSWAARSKKKTNHTKYKLQMQQENLRRQQQYYLFIIIYHSGSKSVKLA